MSSKRVPAPEPSTTTLETSNEANLEEIAQTFEAVGAVKAFEFTRYVASTASISAYEKLKESKGWRFMRPLKGATRRAYESLEEFCEDRFGLSLRRMQELVANRQTIGEELYDKAEQLGIRQKDYAAIKALPAPDKELVRRAVEDAQSREEVISILEEVVVRAHKEREELRETQAELEAARQVRKNQRTRNTLDESDPEAVARRKEVAAFIDAVDVADVIAKVETLIGNLAILGENVPVEEFHLMHRSPRYLQLVSLEEKATEAKQAFLAAYGYPEDTQPEWKDWNPDNSESEAIDGELAE
ncbi:MAG: hypothetical protein LBQ75_08840 [Zoogloeaceae bacterium]|jgi:hypothetical protein|nr:hypothetical protein [Zoogloeaceae bacterium]